MKVSFFKKQKKVYLATSLLLGFNKQQWPFFYYTKTVIFSDKFKVLP